MKRLLPFLCAVIWLTGCTRRAEPIERTALYLDTTVTISLYDTTDTALLDGCFEKIRAYEALFSRTMADSDVARLNAAAGRPVAVTADTEVLLQHGLRLAALSGGAFDPTIGPVSRLWDFHAATPSPPDPAALAAAVALVDYRGLTVGDGEAALPTGAAVDLGGIAKGYIADRLRDYLHEQGVRSALLDLGGNIYALGDKDGRPWKIGIRDPRAPEALAAVVEVRDRSVVTSGSYERSFEQGGVLYHHILDPETGEPVRNGLSSVTILSADSVDGDALSTACFVLGKERGLQLIESLDGMEALFIEEDGTLTATAGFVYHTP